MQILLVGFFGTIGVLARYLCGHTAHRLFKLSFPWDTLAINVIGALAIGVVYVLGVERTSLSTEWRIAITAGFLGGFTTFSAYCLEGYQLFSSGRYGAALAYVGLSPIVGVAAVLIAVLLTRLLVGST